MELESRFFSYCIVKHLCGLLTRYRSRADGGASTPNAPRSAASLATGNLAMHRAKRSFLVDTCAPACAANCALHSAVFVIDKSWPSLFCWATKKTMMLGDIIGKIIQFDVKYFKDTDNDNVYWKFVSCTGSCTFLTVVTALKLKAWITG